MENLPLPSMYRFRDTRVSLGGWAREGRFLTAQKRMEWCVPGRGAICAAIFKQEWAQPRFTNLLRMLMWCIETVNVFLQSNP